MERKSREPTCGSKPANSKVAVAFIGLYQRLNDIYIKKVYYIHTGNKFTKGKTARITKMMAMFVLFSSYVLYLSLLLSGSKVNLACENSLAKHWRN
jgi:hypothetical protein